MKVNPEKSAVVSSQNRRIDQLLELGLKYSGESFNGEPGEIIWDVSFHYTEVFFDDEETFQKKILEVIKKIELREKKVYNPLRGFLVAFVLSFVKRFKEWGSK